MITQQSVIKEFMTALDATNSKGKSAVNEAVKKASNGVYGSVDDLIRKFYSDIIKAKNATTFLKNYCGINLDSKDQWRLVNGIYIGFKKFYQEKCLSFGDKSSYCRFFCMTNRR